MAQTVDDGGQVYPCTEKVRDPSCYPAPGYIETVHLGMSLRDWFAGQALAGLAGNPGGPYQANSMSGWGLVNCQPRDIAGEAYALADAMLAARKAGA